MAYYKRPAVVFNLDNPMQKELYDWCMEQSSNFSDFTRTVLFLYRQGKTLSMTQIVHESSLKPFSRSDAEAMSDML